MSWRPSQEVLPRVTTPTGSTAPARLLFGGGNLGYRSEFDNARGSRMSLHMRPYLSVVRCRQNASSVAPATPRTRVDRVCQFSRTIRYSGRDSQGRLGGATIDLPEPGYHCPVAGLCPAAAGGPAPRETSTLHREVSSKQARVWACPPGSHCRSRSRATGAAEPPGSMGPSEKEKPIERVPSLRPQGPAPGPRRLSE
jgi:hypothetical protein